MMLRIVGRSLFPIYHSKKRLTAIAFDNATRGIRGDVATTLTFSHTVGSGSNRLLILFCNIQVDSTLTATYNGTSMTQVYKQLALGSNYEYCFYLIAPDSGTHDVVLTSGASTSWSASFALSYDGCKQSGQPDSFNSTRQVGVSGDQTVSTTVVASDCWLVFGCYPQDADPGTVVNGTSRGTGNGNVADSNGTVGTGSQSGGWNWGSSDTHAIGIVSIAPFVAVGPTNVASWNGVAAANISTYNGVSWSNVDSINGVT